MRRRRWWSPTLRWLDLERSTSRSYHGSSSLL